MGTGGAWPLPMLSDTSPRHPARSEAESQDPPPSERIPARGSCDCAQDDDGDRRGLAPSVWPPLMPIWPEGFLPEPIRVVTQIAGRAEA